MRFLYLLLILLMAQTSWAEHLEARQFVKEAVLSKLSQSTISPATLEQLLAKDEDGHPLSFIPDCPICLGVQDGLALVSKGSEDKGLPEAFQVEKTSTRTSGVARFVRAAVKEKLGTIESVDQRLDMAAKLKAGSEEGQRQLERYQSRRVEAYKMMWSCLMCDAAAKAGQ